jgi:predicted  nucleic acid-binding Zn-ribbon protein
MTDAVQLLNEQLSFLKIDPSYRAEPNDTVRTTEDEMETKHNINKESMNNITIYLQKELDEKKNQIRSLNNTINELNSKNKTTNNKQQTNNKEERTEIESLHNTIKNLQSKNERIDKITKEFENANILQNKAFKTAENISNSKYNFLRYKYEKLISDKKESEVIANKVITDFNKK